MAINTAFLLMAQYNGKAVIPLEDVRRDFFDYMSIEKLNRKVQTGQLPLPVMRSDTKQPHAK